MSQIDQAFIQAYTPDVPAVPFEALPSVGPQARLNHQSPRPHFSQDEGTDPYSETAALQQGSVQPQSPVVESLQERRPLSSFAAPQAPATEVFRPEFEVDSFRWPAIIDEILHTNGHLLKPAAGQLVEASEAGRSMVGIAGTRPGVGTTTIHLCLAKLLSSVGKSVAIVDGDFANRSLGRELGLQFDLGWENVLTGQAPLAECVVSSISEGVSLLPLVGHETPATDLLASIQTSVSAGVLRYHYDVVLFNLGAAGWEPQSSAARGIVEHCRVDASIIVADVTHTEQASQERIDQLMTLLGPSCLGMIGNEAL
jgi:Mrp family chromosome partitioning ATPase